MWDQDGLSELYNQSFHLGGFIVSAGGCGRWMWREESGDRWSRVKKYVVMNDERECFSERPEMFVLIFVRLVRLFFPSNLP